MLTFTESAFLSDFSCSPIKCIESKLPSVGSPNVVWSFRNWIKLERPRMVQLRLVPDGDGAGKQLGKLS